MTAKLATKTTSTSPRDTEDADMEPRTDKFSFTDPMTETLKTVPKRQDPNLKNAKIAMRTLPERQDRLDGADPTRASQRQERHRPGRIRCAPDTNQVLLGCAEIYSVIRERFRRD